MVLNSRRTARDSGALWSGPGDLPIRTGSFASYPCGTALIDCSRESRFAPKQTNRESKLITGDAQMVKKDLSPIPLLVAVLSLLPLSLAAQQIGYFKGSQLYADAQ